MAEAYEHADDSEAQAKAEYFALLDSIALTLADSRRKAVMGRRQLGIETEWTEDQEFYEGIDDANRHEVGTYRGKPPGQASLASEEDADDGSVSSVVFPNITRPYVDAAAARVGDMLLPTDDRAWQIKPTPVPELIELIDVLPTQADIDEIAALHREADESERQSLIDKDLARLTRERFPKHLREQIDGKAASDPELAGNQEAIDKVYRDLAVKFEEDMETARKSAREAERQIDDWHTEGQYHTQMRQGLEGCARLGTGVLKGPIPMAKQHIAYRGGALVMEEKIKPVSKSVSIWNCFPDPACGQSIHDGEFHFERDDISYRGLVELKSQPGYEPEMIDLVLSEGPAHVSAEVSESEEEDGMFGLKRRDKRTLYELWYCYTFLKREDLEGLGVEIDQTMDSYPLIPVEATMVNNHIIKITLSHLDTGEFPYDYVVWQRRIGMPYGMGVARQIRTPQRIYTAAWRNLMDNAGLAGGPMWAYLHGAMHPMDGNPELRPRKGWMVDLDMVNDPRLLQYALQYIDMDMKTDELMAIAQSAKQMAEDVTGLPMLMQGQQGNAPDTVGGMNILNNNASTVLRRIARLFDDLVTEPHVRRYYTYLLQYGESDDAKREFVIDARGSSALVERDLNNQAISQMLNMVSNPSFGVDPKKWFAEWLKSQRLDPKRFEYDDDKWKEIVEGMVAAQQQQDTSLQVAEIRAQAQLAVAEIRKSVDEMKVAADQESKGADRMLKAAQFELSQQANEAFKMLDAELEQMSTAGAREIAVDKIKAMLADTRMKLDAQFEMQSGQVVEPEVEPAGRAPDGQAFAR